MLRSIGLVVVKSIAYITNILFVCLLPNPHLQYLSVIRVVWLCWIEERLPVHHS